MFGARLPVIAASLSMFFLAGTSLASEKCELAANYLLPYEEELKFAVTIHRCNEFWRLEFEEFAGRLANGDPVWNVLEQLEVAKLAPDEIMVSQTCSIGGVADQGIVVVARQSDEDWFTELRVAWWTDREFGQWKPLDPRTVRCWNESAGI